MCVFEFDQNKTMLLGQPCLCSRSTSECMNLPSYEVPAVNVVYKAVISGRNIFPRDPRTIQLRDDQDTCGISET